MRPAIRISHHLESQSEIRPRPSNTHHCVVGLCIVKVIVAAPLRKEWTIPVGRDVATSYTDCIQVNEKKNYIKHYKPSHFMCNAIGCRTYEYPEV